jgi:hypothetical protein
MSPVGKMSDKALLEPYDAFSSNSLAFTYRRHSGAYARLVERIKHLCSGDRLVNVEVHEKEDEVGRWCWCPL